MGRGARRRGADHGASRLALDGGLLFTTDACKYAAMPLFQVKMALVGLGALNALYVARKRATAGVALISPIVWTGALVCGRFVGYL